MRYWFTTLCIAVAVISLLNGCNQPATKDSSLLPEKVYLKSQEFVKDRLAWPDKSTFAPYSSGSVIPFNDTIFIVKGTVTIDNGQTPTFTNIYSCRLIYHPVTKTVDCVDLTLLQPQEERDQQKEIREKLVQSLQIEIQQLTTLPAVTNFDELKARMAFYLQCQKDIHAANYQRDSTLDSLTNALLPALQAVQKKQFPVLRKLYGEVMKKQLWIDDMKCHVSGQNNDVIVFTDAAFYNNRDKKEAYDKIAVQLNAMRFIKAVIRSNYYDDNPGNFEIQSPSDTALVYELP